MKTSKQFWTLFKFQTAANPFIWFMPLVLGAPFFLGFFEKTFANYHPDLSSLLMLMTQNLFFVGLLGVMVLAPERYMFGAANAAITISYGTEFLLTRAIDRPILYRSRAVLLYFLLLIMPLVTVLNSMRNPDLTVSEYSNIVQQQCLSHVPGSILIPNPSGNRQPLISIPRGNVLVEGWHFWVFLAFVIGVQVVLLLLQPLKYGRFIFWALYMGAVFLPLFGIINSSYDKTSPLSFSERLFFSFAAHQLLFWILTALVLILAQIWCERRFSRLEQ